MNQFKNYFVTLNIFQSPTIDENPYRYRTNVIATRVYLIVLVLILFILLLLTSFNAETINIVISNPTSHQIESLPENRICPCSKISFSHATFVLMNASLHQVCSSDFISDQWISSLFYEKNASRFLPVDFRSIGFAQFQALASFCRLSTMHINRIISLFGSTSFISSHLVSSPIVLRKQVQTIADRFQLSIQKEVQSQIQLINTQTTHNHALNGLSTSIIPNRNRAYVNYYDKQIGFKYNSYMHTNDSKPCVCTQTQSLTDDSCRGQSGIYEGEFDVDTVYIGEWFQPTILIPDFVSSCMPVDACLLSSFECFYNQSCVDAILPYQKRTNGLLKNFTALNSKNVSPTNRYNKSTRIQAIVDQFMVEEWFIEENYKKYFEQCAPASCNYLADVYPDFWHILNILIGLLGGLCTVLGLLVAPVVGFIRRRLWPPPPTLDFDQPPSANVSRKHTSKRMRV